MDLVGSLILSIVCCHVGRPGTTISGAEEDMKRRLVRRKRCDEEEVALKDLTEETRSKEAVVRKILMVVKKYAERVRVAERSLASLNRARASFGTGTTLCYHHPSPRRRRASRNAPAEAKAISRHFRRVFYLRLFGQYPQQRIIIWL